MASSNEMELYAEPIPPTLAGKAQPPLSRANFREVVLRRLTAVQEQKKCLNNSPVRIPSSHSEIWKSEKDILVEMLEKTQKMQLASQQAWTQERENLERQLKRMEAQYRMQVETLKGDNERLRGDLARAKVAEEDVGKKSDFLLQMQEVVKKHQEREDGLLAQTKTLETALLQYKEGLDKATEELEKKRFLADEQSALLEAKAEATISALRKEVAQSQSVLREKEDSIRAMSQELAQVRSQLEALKKKKASKAAFTQTDVRSDEFVRLQNQLEDAKRENAALRSQKEAEVFAAKDENTRLSQALMTANAALRAQAVVTQSVHSNASQQDLLARLQESLQQLKKCRDVPATPQLAELKAIFSEEGGWMEIAKPVAALRSAVAEIMAKCESTNEAIPKALDSEERAKLCIEMYAGSLKALLDLTREGSPADSLLQLENERLKKERDTLLVAIQSMKGKTFESQVEALKVAIAKIETAAKAVQSVDSVCAAVKTKCMSVLSALESCVMQIKEKAELEAATESSILSQLHALLPKLGPPPSPDRDNERRVELLQQQKERLEEALSKLKQMHDGELEALTQQYESYQELVHAERGRLCDSLLKVAESVEYRQDVWEQLQTAGDSDSKEMTEELERQTQWELKTLAVLMTRLQDPLQKEDLLDVNAIAEEEEEDDGDEQQSVVIRLR